MENDKVFDEGGCSCGFEANASPEPHVVVPGGWQLVPKRLTGGMMAAACKGLDNTSSMNAAYELALEAAPSPEPRLAVTEPQMERAEAKLSEVLAGFDYVLPADGMRQVLEAAIVSPPAADNLLALEKTMRQIAAQKLTSEITSSTLVANDIEGTHDAMILEARAAMSGNPPPETLVEGSPTFWIWRISGGDWQASESEPSSSGAPDVECYQVGAASVTRMEALELALKPFADIAPCVEYTDKRDGDVVHRQDVVEDGRRVGWKELTKDDFRRAVAALGTSPQPRATGKEAQND